MQLEASNSGDLQPTAARFDPRSGRFDVSFEIGNDVNAAPTKLRFTGTAYETVEAAVLTRNVDRTEVLKSSDIVIERRPKLEVGPDIASRDRAVGMQARKQLRSGQALKTADLAKPDLVQRDQNVTLIYEAAGLYLTVGGKAVDGGTEGDVVNVLNLQSKRVISGVVVGRGQVAIAVATPRLPPASAPSVTTGSADTTASISVAAGNNSQVSPKAE
jgi:flagellar basal body P-ring formation protein FlgA